jgi:demethoxyubiquinone hydroxylase (CLK1/Coq7/Cat5 family)
VKVNTLHLPALETLPISAALRRDLRSDHAGETGAVYIYRGILRHTSCPEVISFARTHLTTETKHLNILEDWLPSSNRSKLLPLWRLSGWLLGAVAAKLGRDFTFATIVAVERFVVAHYQAQIVQTDGVLRELLISLQSDEAAHRDDAETRLSSTSIWHSLWSRVVHSGSAAAVYVARRI